MNRFWRPFHRQWSGSRTNRVRFYNSSDQSNQQSFPHFPQAFWGGVATILTGIAVVGSGGFFTTLAYVQWIANSNENKIKKRFNSPITITEDLDDYIPRSDVESYLKKILTASKVANYWVVSGEHDAQKAILQTIGYPLMENWSGIEKSYRPTCKRIISYAFNHDWFDEAELAKQILTGWWGQKDDVTESVESLVKANVLSDIGGGTYTLHSKVVKEYLVANMNKLR